MIPCTGTDSFAFRPHWNCWNTVETNQQRGTSRPASPVGCKNRRSRCWRCCIYPGVADDVHRNVGSLCMGRVMYIQIRVYIQYIQYIHIHTLVYIFTYIHLHIEREERWICIYTCVCIYTPQIYICTNLNLWCTCTCMIKMFHYSSWWWLVAIWLMDNDVNIHIWRQYHDQSEGHD